MELAGAQKMLNLRVVRKNNDSDKIIELAKVPFKAVLKSENLKCPFLSHSFKNSYIYRAWLKCKSHSDETFVF